MSKVLANRIKGIVSRFNAEIIDASTKDEVKMVPEIRTCFDEKTGIFQLKLGRVSAVYLEDDSALVPEKAEAALAEKPQEIICNSEETTSSPS